MDLTMIEYGTQEFENIVFVDIDGVFNHIKTKCDYQFIGESVGVINNLYKSHNIQLVLSSSWKNAYSFQFMQKLFKDNGIKAPLIDKTMTYFNNHNNNSLTLGELEKENIDIHYSREYEIFSWIKIFKPKHYLILDDYRMDDEELRKHQVLTNYFGKNEKNMALRRTHLEECERILSI